MNACEHECLGLSRSHFTLAKVRTSTVRPPIKYPSYLKYSWCPLLSVRDSLNRLWRAGRMKLGLTTMLAFSITFAAEGDFRPNGRVILLTDYGADSVYVGILKGVIYSHYPQARVDSITNSIPPFDVLSGAYVLAEACGVFPKGTVFCCVVDPGVGTSRKCIALKTNKGHLFVGPDNGLLSLVAEQEGIADVRECTNKTLWRDQYPSHTFQGRDIFGPVAAALASGVPLTNVGPKLDRLVALEVPRSRIEDDTVHGVVIRADTYGNLITNIRAKDLQTLGLRVGDSLQVTVGQASYAAPWVATYADVPEGKRLVLIQSAGFVECATNLRSLVEELGEGLRAPVTITKTRPTP